MSNLISEFVCVNSFVVAAVAGVSRKNVSAGDILLNMT